MKKGLMFLSVLITGLFFLGCQSASSNKEKSGEPSEAAVVEKTFHISGMHCDMCEASIEKGIGELDGIEHVQASWNDSTAIVKYDEAVTGIDDIQKAIEKRGYSVKSEQNN
ncbi:MAG: heavy-metal-associated domain-containing protein [Tangfeifania sp.]